MPSPKTIEAGDAARRKEAEMGSAMLLIALLRYGSKRGLPNYSADQCRRKLENMA